MIISGNGVHHESAMLNNPYDGKTEAEAFTEVVLAAGVPKEKIILENEANHTGENFSLTKKLLESEEIAIEKAIVVTKTYMERRAYATGKAQWSQAELIMSSPKLSFSEYLTDTLTEKDIINIMLGDLHRIKEYPAHGFQIKQDIPSQVWDAFEILKNLGYTKHLLK